jgi:hypothetical protein
MEDLKIKYTKLVSQNLKCVKVNLPNAFFDKKTKQIYYDINVSVSVIDIYSGFLNVKLNFLELEKEQIFYTPISLSMEEIVNKFKKFVKIVVLHTLKNLNIIDIYGKIT